MSKELDEAWTTIYHYNDEIIHDMGSEYVENPLKEEIDIVNNALLELKAIKEANPSEALECLEELDNCLISDMSVECDDYDESNYCMSYEYIDFNGEGLNFYDTYKEERMMEFIRGKKMPIIKQALIKAQEPKKYLKWEDLEFKENKEIDVLMNGNKYVLELRPKDTRREYLDEVILYNIEKQGVIALNEIEAETFNDLHLEVLKK